MSYRDNEHIKDCVESLAKLLNPFQTISENVVDKLVRFLRPAGGTANEHAKAIKDSIRRGIVNHPSSGSDGLTIQSKFDKECLKLEYRLLKSFLSLFKPLSYHIDHPRPTINNPAHTLGTHNDEFVALNINNTIRNERHFLPNTHFDPIAPQVPQETNYTDSNEYSEFNSLLDTNVMWATRETELKLINDLIYVFQVSKLCHSPLRH